MVHTFSAIYTIGLDTGKAKQNATMELGVAMPKISEGATICQDLASRMLDLTYHC